MKWSAFTAYQAQRAQYPDPSYTWPTEVYEDRGRPGTSRPMTATGIWRENPYKYPPTIKSEIDIIHTPIDQTLVFHAKIAVSDHVLLGFRGTTDEQQPMLVNAVVESLTHSLMKAMLPATPNRGEICSSSLNSPPKKLNP